MNMTNLDEGAIRHLISIHEEAISQLKLQIAHRPSEPANKDEKFPPAVGFFRPSRDYPGDPTVDRPFVAIRYSVGQWYINRGGGAPSVPMTWDELLDWIGVAHWKTIAPLIPAERSNPNTGQNVGRRVVVSNRRIPEST